MKAAIPIWEGKVSPVLDTALKLLVIEVDNKKEISRFEAHLDDLNLSRRCSRILGLGVDTLICGAISRPFYRMLVAGGINVVPWVSGFTEDVLEAYLSGKLFDSRFLMPGCNWQEREESATIDGESATT
jgi:predicted Fe-Mo cluster-binding NifX family protein